MKFKLTSKFGALEEVRNGRPHNGIDLAMPEGTTLRSIAKGEITKVYNDDSIGRGVKIEGEDGREYIYGHMEDVDVKVGDHVNIGSVIGESGNTGHSTGPHLHFGVKNDDGEFINPGIFQYRLDRLQGDYEKPHWWDISGRAAYAVDEQTLILRENMREYLIEGFSVLGEVLIEMLGAITLVGSGILILLKIAGYDKGFKYAGVLFVVNTIVKYLFGGNTQ